MENYQTTIRGLFPNHLKSEDVEQAVRGWDEYMKLMNVTNEKADSLFLEIIKDRFLDGAVSIAPPNAEEIEFYAFIHGKPVEINQTLI